MEFEETILNKRDTATGGGWFVWLLLLGIVLRLALGGGLYLYAKSVQPDDPMVAASDLIQATDPFRYQRQAKSLAGHWQRYGITSGDLWPLVDSGFTLILAGLYYIFGSHFMVSVVFNALCAAGLALLARRLALLAGQGPVLSSWLALLVMYWPPSLIWGAFPLRDELSYLLIFACLVLLLEMLNPRRSRPWAALWGLGLALAFLVWFLCSLRVYINHLLLPMSLAGCLFSLPAGLKSHGKAWLIRLVLILVLCLPVGYMAWTNPLHMAVQRNLARGDQSWLGDRNHFSLGTMKEYLLMSLRGPGQVAYQARVMRREFVKLGGDTLQKPDAPSPAPTSAPKEDKAPRSLLPAMAGRGLSSFDNAFLSPHPWQPWPGRPGWDYLSLGMSAFGLFWYLLIPGVAAGCILAVFRWPSRAGVICVFGLSLGLAMGYVVPNLGSLFRLRDLALLPLLVLWNPAPYLWLAGRPKKPKSSLKL